ncbi:hypothetical protein [Hydrogenophaga sp.]|uniref:hypothetical protein n=1 Tax=Hydrogenophaga sp. TaxID=1904254 RepID=UPI002717EEB7|nr:hypothetical protein [Hydrogenophaga sp.]MDO8905956.1 hypothetical protein [Hydrogenophaga sp.]
MQTIETLQHDPALIDPTKSFLSEARIMAPYEVADAFTSRGDELPPELKGRWSLCGEATESLFDVTRELHPSKLGIRLSAFTSNSGGVYAVLTLQMLLRQHRFLLPLWDLDVLSSMRGAIEGKLCFMLARGGSNEAIVFPSEFKRHDIEPLLDLVVPAGQDTDATHLSQMWAAVQMIQQMKAIPGFDKDREVEEVMVSVVPPTHTLKRLFSDNSVRH